MTVGGRIAIGTGVVLTLLLSILAWDVLLVDRLAEVNRTLSRIDFRASTTTLEMTRSLNEIDEFTRKYHVTGDPAYNDRLTRLRAEFAADLASLRSLDLAPRVRQPVGRLLVAWQEYWRQWARYSERSEETATGPVAEAELLAIASIRRHLGEVGYAARTLVMDQALQSVEVSGWAQRLSWSIAAAAVITSFLILGLTIRSINRPLTRLTEGTQAVADGEFSVRLEAAGGDELSRLATSFNRMVERLAAAERAKKDFLSHVSHELKTPLASMQETNELLLEEIAGPLSDKQKRFLQLNLDSSQRLSAMLSRLLDLSRMEAGAMEYEFRRRDLTEIARSVAAGFEARALEEQKRIVVQAPERAVEVECDFDRMIQVLQNLVDNALKHSEAGSPVEIRVFPAGVGGEPPDWIDLPDGDPGPELSDMTLLEVADRGPGIPVSQRPLVFRRFHQIDTTGRGFSGSGVGLGLAICREIVQAHQGWIGLRDHEGGGSVFVVALPASPIGLEAVPETRTLRRQRVTGV